MYVKTVTQGYRIQRLSGCLGCALTSTLGADGDTFPTVPAPYDGGITVPTGASAGGASSGIVQDINAVGKVISSFVGGGKSTKGAAPGGQGTNFLTTLPNSTLVIGGIASLAFLIAVTR